MLSKLMNKSFSFLIIRLMKQMHDGFSTFILIYAIILVYYNFVVYRVDEYTLASSHAPAWELAKG